MKKKVSIFVAGSKDLRIERYSLKALAQELNTRYNEKAVDVFVEMKSYEDFKDNQKEYNSYITNKADMALFVLDGRIGKFTKSELITAVDAYKKKQIPEIVVFLKNFKEETSDIQQIMELLEDLFGKDFFYVNYEDAADLKFKAETRISRFISPTDHIRSTKKWKMITAMCACIALFLCLASVFVFFNPQSYDKGLADEAVNYRFNPFKPIKLFMGGGSVGMCLKENNIDTDSMENTIYLGVPTGDLWNIMGEQYYKTKQNTEQEKEQRFFPIFFAANKIDTSRVKQAIATCENIHDITEKILIFQLFLANDTLKVYIGDNWYNQNDDKVGIRGIANNGVIDDKQLEKIICKALGDLHLWTTSVNSGTLKAFNEEALEMRKIYKPEQHDTKQNLKEIVSDTTNGHKVYFETTEIQDKKDCVVLGSSFFYPKDINCHHKLSVKRKTDNDIIYKKLYLYFIAYRDDRKEAKTKKTPYYIPESVREFLDHLNEKFPFEEFYDNDGYYTREVPEDGIVKLRNDEKDGKK